MEPKTVDITNADLESQIQVGQGQQPLYVFALKDLATVTLNLTARTALSNLARKLSKLYAEQADLRTDLVFAHGTKDADGNLEVKRTEMVKEDGTLDKEKWKKWQEDIRAWRAKPILDGVAQITLPVYQEDVEILNPEFLAALTDLVAITIQTGDKPGSLRNENEKLRKRVADQEATIKTITETVQKKGG